ncbi:hypothetical protein [Enterococcus malodoratus]|uniref:hypothetical protein n=1 Tax=Enterococcus malodoratus TaxID=71451 RepID=UPI0039AFEFD2
MYYVQGIDFKNFKRPFDERPIFVVLVLLGLVVNTSVINTIDIEQSVSSTEDTERSISDKDFVGSSSDGKETV